MPAKSLLQLAVPDSFDLAEAVCSYGYFLLAPNRWRPRDQAYERRFQPGEFGLPDAEPFVARVTGAPAGAGRLRVAVGRSLNAAERKALRGVLARTLRLDEDLAPWWRKQAAARRRGFGRLFRSPTLFEDMVKTITNCNVGWPSTVRMNALLVDRVGQGAFPTPGQLARLAPSRLQKVAKVGYRAKRIVGLARRFERGDLDPGWFESPRRSTEELAEAIGEIDGFGPYATANVLQLLGRYDRLPIDTETIRLHCKRTGVERPADDAHLHDAIRARYRRYGRHRFLAYWFDLWRDYESAMGRSRDWDPDTVATSFTASQLKTR